MKLGMVVHTCNASAQRENKENQKFKIILGYILSLMEDMRPLLTKSIGSEELGKSPNSRMFASQD